jgi:hypothetical protein
MGAVSVPLGAPVATTIEIIASAMIWTKRQLSDHF